MMWELDDLAGNSDLADEYGVTRATICNWSTRYPEFPRPVTVIGGRPVWSRAQVAQWVGAECDQL